MTCVMRMVLGSGFGEIRAGLSGSIQLYGCFVTRMLAGMSHHGAVTHACS